MNVAETARNIVCAGGRPLAITDGLNFGNPMKPENYWQFTKCIEGMSEACAALDTPVISGNVSFYNENPKGPIDPSPMVGMVGIIDDVDKHVTQDFKNEGDVIVLLGENRADLSGSEYLYIIHSQKKGNPQIDIKKEKDLHQAVLSAIDLYIINSAHDCSEGGLAVTLAESAISNSKNMLGADIKLDNLKTGDARRDEILFGEVPSRIIVSVSKDNLDILEEIAKQHSVACQVIGNVDKDRFLVSDGADTVIDLPLAKLSSTWREAITSRLK